MQAVYDLISGGARGIDRDKILSLLSMIDDSFVQLEANWSNYPFDLAYDKLISIKYFLSCVVHYARDNDCDTENIREHLPNAWCIHSGSSFVRHLQQWPRGYAGDFDAINAIADRVETAEFQSIYWAVGHYALNSTIAQQHREKLKIQADAIKAICAKFKQPCIISIACGSSRDIEQCQREIRESGARVILIDFDKDAIADSMSRLGAIRQQVEPHVTDVRRLPKLFGFLGENDIKYHLIYAGGLFDYLPDGIIGMILNRLSPLVAEGGEILFTNIAEGNPFKCWIETMANWKLIYRTRQDMERMLELIPFKEKSVYREPTQLAYIARAVKA